MLTARQVYRSRQWAIVRQRVKRRDGWKCVLCGYHGRIEVDHIVALKDGGAPFDPLNLRSLCRRCHIGRTADQNRRPATEQDRQWDGLVDELMPATAAPRNRRG